ncbi:MAG: fucose isomerase [Candidatus Lokiarchaeota archaeon]|nr:fucose isomerase [Candidatus Lokiarchaeota archaeon]
MLNSKNKPEVKLGLIAVSRDCFPIELSKKRKMAVISEAKNQNLKIEDIEIIVENENDVLNALNEIEKKKINSLIIFLGNFGPEGPLTMLAQKFSGPVMICAAAEESQTDLINGRGDAYCGLLSACYNLGLRNQRIYLPEYPLGTAMDIVNMIREFIPISRVIIGIKNLKIFTFGPRPQDFYTCHAPIKPLFDLGIEIMENSELDLLDIFNKAKNHPNIKKIRDEMKQELGDGNQYPELLERLAQYEVALMNFYQENIGAKEFGIFAIKCWPAFEEYFQFVPCYVNSRMAKKGIPIACEVDVYGALSEYMAYLATEKISTILDINNTVPKDMYEGNHLGEQGFKHTDLFMGFHCGNTATDCMKTYKMNFQLIMHRLLEPESDPNITRGTLEGQMKPGDVTIFRIQSTPEVQMRAYIAQGEILDIPPKTFGTAGIFAISEMGRFYRYALLEKQFPHHTSVAFKHCGKTLFEALKLLGIKDISVNLPEKSYFNGENIFK